MEMFNLTSDCPKGGLFCMHPGTILGVGLHRRELSDDSDKIFDGWELLGEIDSTSEGREVSEAFDLATDGTKLEIIISFVEQIGDEAASGVGDTTGIGFEAK